MSLVSTAKGHLASVHGLLYHTVQQRCSIAWALCSVGAGTSALSHLMWVGKAGHVSICAAAGK